MSVETDPVPPVPEHSAPLREDQFQPIEGKLISQPWARWFTSVREKINVINALLVSLGKLVGSGFIVSTGTSATVRTLQQGPGISISNGSGVADDPTISHADTSSITDFNINNSGGVVIQDLTMTFDDTFGHVQSVSIGSVNLDGRYDPAGSAAAILTGTISAGDTTHAPTGNAVFNALALKFDKAGGTISGNVQPNTDNTHNLGGSSNRWANIYGTSLRPGAGTTIWTSGSGSPEGSVTAVVGSLYTRTDGGSGTTLYVKESGASNTGWVAVSSGGGGGGGSLVYVGTYEIAGAAATELDITGLDLDTDNKYIIEFTWLNALGAGVSLNLYYNNDNTSTNYDYQNFLSSGATISNGRGNTAYSLITTSANSDAQATIEISKDINDKPVAFISSKENSGVSISFRSGVRQWRTGGVNVTSIKFSSPSVGALSVGTKAIVWKQLAS